MAIYHFSAQIISRSSGKCATAAAAYRARNLIHDERTGVTYDYSYKDAADYCEILAPVGAMAWVSDRQTLWNKVEAAERRKDSQLAREINVALPVELGKEQKIELGLKFVRDTYVSKGMVTDIAFHDLDSHNPHFHVMLTTRQLEGDGFTKTKEKAWQPEFTYYKGQKGKAQGDALDLERQAWQDYANVALMMAGLEERIDRRTLEAQGIGRLPQIHLGPVVAAMEKKGISTTIGDEYRQIEQLNAELGILSVRLDITSNQILEEQRQQQEALRQLELERQRQEGERKRIEALQQRLREEERKRLEEEEQLRLEALQRSFVASNEQLLQIFNTAQFALELYGSKSNSITAFVNEYHRIEQSLKFNQQLNHYQNYLVIKTRSSQDKLLELEWTNIEQLYLVNNNLDFNNFERLVELQGALEHCQRVKQFYKNAQMALTVLGKIDPKHPDTLIFEGPKYRITSSPQSFKVIAKDGRGEILNYPYKVRHPETEATANFADTDFDLFAENIKIIRDAQQAQAEKEREQNSSRSQGYGRGRGRSRGRSQGPELE